MSALTTITADGNLSTIPLSRIVKVTPSALAAASGVGFINGLILSTNSAVPPGTLKAYADAASVAKDFTATAPETQMAEAYFAGFTGTLNTPSKLYFHGVAPSVQGTTQDGAPADATMASDPATIMNALLAISQDFAAFTTAWEPSLSEKQAFATWNGAQGCRYWYVAWDTDKAATASPATGKSFGEWLSTQGVDGTTAVYQRADVAAFCLGWAASLDFTATAGRFNLAGRKSPVLANPDGSAADYDALKANGYSVYGSFGNGLGRWNMLQNGAVSGQFLWADTYINQLWLNAALQADLINLITSVGQIPYNAEGDGLMNAALAATRAQAKRFGAVEAGVTLTDLQNKALQRLFGRDVSNELFSQGDVFAPQASTTPADVRASRGSPPAIYAYNDGGSIQAVNLSSIATI
ncbi:DUF3383 family protein [Formicincola oecophyllae]|nr:DUF3383 family protein [Formicincola oecophyllae]